MIFLILALSIPALAGDPATEPKVIYKDKTEIDFEAIDVHGKIVKPQGALLLDRRRARFNPMIKLRMDFDDEMDKSVDEIK
jgi:hypothetical protein